MNLDEHVRALITEEVARAEARLRGEFALNSKPSPYLSVQEAAEYLRCSRQRIDDLLSQRRLTRHKDGSRTLILRAEVEGYPEEQVR